MDTGGSGLSVNCLGRLEITLDGRLLEPARDQSGRRPHPARACPPVCAGGGTELMTAIWDEELPTTRGPACTP